MQIEGVEYPDYRPGEIIVRLESPQSLPAMLDWLAREKGATAFQRLPGPDHAERLLAQLDPNRKTADAIKLIESDPNVKFAEPVPVRWIEPMEIVPYGGWKVPEPEDVPEPPPREGEWARSAAQWPDRWDHPLDSIAILDSGADTSHPALKDGVHVVTEGPDRSGHGTFVSGMIAARHTITRKKKQWDVLPGILYGSKVTVWNIMDPRPLSSGDRKLYMVDPARYHAALSAIGTGDYANIKVVNLSIGSAELSKTEREDIALLEKRGVSVVASAGNLLDKNVQLPVMYPAAYETVISVGAMAMPLAAKPNDPPLQLWDRSRWGSPLKGVKQKSGGIDVVAPGQYILSAIPTYENATGFVFSCWQNGTSMAAPIVTAAVAILRYKNPEMTPVQVRQQLAARFPLETISGKRVRRVNFAKLS